MSNVCVPASTSWILAFTVMIISSTEHGPVLIRMAPVTSTDDERKSVYSEIVKFPSMSTVTSASVVVLPDPLLENEEAV